MLMKIRVLGRMVRDEGGGDVERWEKWERWEVWSRVFSEKRREKKMTRWGRRRLNEKMRGHFVFILKTFQVNIVTSWL